MSNHVIWPASRVIPAPRVRPGIMPASYMGISDISGHQSPARRCMWLLLICQPLASLSLVPVHDASHYALISRRKPTHGPTPAAGGLWDCISWPPLVSPDAALAEVHSTSPFYGQPYLFCPGDVAAPHSIKFFKTPHHSWISKSISCTNTEFPLVTSDTVSRPLPEHSTTQTPHNNPHVCRPHRNGTPSLLSERHNAARNTRTCGLMTRHAPPVMTRK